VYPSIFYWQKWFPIIIKDSKWTNKKIQCIKAYESGKGKSNLRLIATVVQVDAPATADLDANAWSPGWGINRWLLVAGAFRKEMPSESNKRYFFQQEIQCWWPYDKRRMRMIRNFGIGLGLYGIIHVLIESDWFFRMINPIGTPLNRLFQTVR